jgi:tryptophanyl-tRNA synthetase
VFTIPEAMIQEAVAVVPGVDGQKMSKSYNNHLEIFGVEKETRARCMRIVTDSTPLEAPKDPDKCNVFALYRLVASPDQAAALAQRYRAGGFGYGEGKKLLFEALWEYFAPFRRRREELVRNPDYVDAVLRDGAARAQAEARKTLAAARRAVGLD